MYVERIIAQAVCRAAMGDAPSAAVAFRRSTDVTLELEVTDSSCPVVARDLKPVKEGKGVRKGSLNEPKSESEIAS